MRLPTRHDLWENEGGFTLFEAIIAVAVFGVIAVALLGALASGLRSQRTQSDRLEALNLARSQLESIEHQPFQESPASYEIISPVPEGFSIQVDVSVPVAYAYPGISALPAGDTVQQIAVTVSYSPGTITLEGYKTDEGIE